MASLVTRIKNAIKYGFNPVRSTRRFYGFSSGFSVNPESAMQVSAYYRGVNYISTQIAKLPWEIKDRAYAVMETSPEALLLDLQPNPEMNAFMWRLLMVSTAINKGNSYAEIERDITGRPVALWPMNTTDVQPERTLSGKLVYRIIGSSLMYRGEDVFLRPEDVFHLRNLYTRDGLMGESTISYASDVLGIAIGANQMASSLYANGGMPSGVLSAQGALDDEAYARIEASWKESHAGRKAGSVAILEEGMTFTPVNWQPDVMQFLESRKFSVIEIARFLGVPPAKLYDGDVSTYNNIEHAGLEVATDTLDAWARNLESEADIKILNRRKGGKFTELDLYAVFRGDMNTRSQYFQRMMQNAAMTPNEIRKAEGKAPYKGGDTFYIANNNFAPVDRMNELIDAQIASKNKVEDTRSPEQKARDAEASALLKEILEIN